jgi:hypothetical protein
MLVSVAKMATVLEDFTTEYQRSVARFQWAKGLSGKNFQKKCSVGSVCPVKQFTTEWQTFR